MKEESLAESFFDRVWGVLEGRNMKLDEGEIRLVLLHVTGYFAATGGNVPFEKQIELAAQRVAEIDDDSLISNVLQSVMVTRRFLRGLGAKIGKGEGAEAQYFAVVAKTLLTGPLGGLFDTDGGFLKRLYFLEAGTRLAERSSIGNKSGLELTWFISLWKEVRTILESSTGALVEGRVSTSLGATQRLLRSSSVTELVKIRTVLSCLSPKMRAPRPSAKKLEYVRIFNAWWEEHCATKATVLKDLHTKAYLMASDECLAYEDAILNPARFVYSIAAYPWPRSPSAVYANTIHQFFTFNKRLVLQHELGKLPLTDLQKANNIVVGDLVDATLSVLGIQHGNVIRGYEDVTVEKLVSVYPDNPFEEMARSIR